MNFRIPTHLQFRIIRALQGDGHLFMVGDVKQAIYRFIGSDVRVFLAQEAAHRCRWATSARRIAMAENYRTRAEILGVLNGLFTRLWPEESQRGARRIPLRAAAAPAGTLPRQRCNRRRDWPSGRWISGNSGALRDREAAWIARRILQLTGRLVNPRWRSPSERDGAR